MPSVRTTLADEEVEVCRRATDLRKLAGLEQKQLSELLHTTIHRLISYENLRTPIRYELGDSLCRLFDINQRWLAVGTLPLFGYFEIPDDLLALAELPHRVLFRPAVESPHIRTYLDNSVDAYATHLNCAPEEIDLHMVSNHERALRSSVKDPLIDPASLMKPVLLLRISQMFDQLPPSARSRFFRHVGRAVADFGKKS